MRGSVVRLAVIVEGGLVVLAWGLGWLLGVPPYKRVSPAWPAVAWGASATLPLLLGLWWCSRTDWGPFPRLMREVEERLVPPFSDCSYFDLALISLLAGVGEEALFRGVLQAALAGWLGPWAALAAASALFGLGHCITPTYALLAALIGLYLGLLWMAYDNLLLVIVAHGLYDFLALIYLLKRYEARRLASPGYPPSNS